ncbi:MAG: cation diffusion facilitator family transporter [Dehalococcoidia bacterium]
MSSGPATHEHDDHHHDDRDQPGHGGHGHTHGLPDATLTTSSRGLWALKWSFVALMTTAILQTIVFLFTGSVALLADTIHNFSDAATAIPLGIAFWLARRPPTRRFTYGLGRAEDLAGIAIVGLILFTALFAAWESVQRLIEPRPIEYLWAVALASLIGFAGNEAVAIFRIRVGKRINSAALVADGYHARADGLTSLAVLAGVTGVALGFPLADPIVGLLISAAILKIVWESGREIFSRTLDGIDPTILTEIEHTLSHVAAVREVGEVRVRWIGHQLHAEANLAVDPEMTVGEAHDVALEARHEVLHTLTYLREITIHVDPADRAGEIHHRILSHAHGDLDHHAH